MIEIDLPKLVGKGYGTFWNFKGRYRVVKGSRASKKSKTMALWLIYNIMKYPLANALVVRRVYSTLKNSCYSDLKWAIYRFKAEEYWRCTENPLTLTYLPTGQVILFRGLDNGLKLTSISVPKGVLNFVWLEESYELQKEEDFNLLDESIRGELPPDYFYSITLTLNPWSDKHWIKKRFFDRKSDDVLALTTTYKCNEWIDENYKKMLEEMKEINPRRYNVAALGQWGVTDGLVYENWQELEFDWREILRKSWDYKVIFGLDFGYSNDPTAFFCGIINKETRELYVFDEIYKLRMQNRDIYESIKNKGFSKEKIFADCAEPKSIDELKGYGLARIKPSKKGRDSINNGIQFIQGYKIYVHPSCKNFINEISQYSWSKDKWGEPTNVPVDRNNHLMDAMRYALQEYIKRPNRLWFGI